MNRYLILLASILFCNSCCTKKGCPDRSLPLIHIKFSGLDPENESAIRVYTLDKNVVTDSFALMLRASTPVLSLSPFQRYENMPDKAYTLKWNNRTETISGMSCDFREEKVKCNKCFPFSSDKVSLQNYSTFVFHKGNEKFLNPDTLHLNW